MAAASIQQTQKVHIFRKQWYVGQRALELYCPHCDGWLVCHRLPVQQRGMFMAICTYSCTQSHMSSRLGMWVNQGGCLQWPSRSRRAGKETNKGENTITGSPSDVECVCKQIAVFYGNLNLSCGASYQACWQRRTYLSHWQDERGGREGEREKTCQRWLITSQANSWVLCLHLDSQGRLRWASLIRPPSCCCPTHMHMHSLDYK